MASQCFTAGEAARLHHIPILFKSHSETKNFSRLQNVSARKSITLILDRNRYAQHDVQEKVCVRHSPSQSRHGPRGKVIL
jgi:hypothetical protein